MSHCPSRIARTAFKMAIVPLAQAVELLSRGPRRSCSIATTAQAVLGSHCSNQGCLPGGMRSCRPRRSVDVVVVAHVGADRAAEAVAVDFREIDAAVGERFGRRDPRERNVLELAGEVGFDVDRRAEQQAIGNSRDAGESTNAAGARLHRLPDRFSIATDGRHDADAGDHDPIVAQSAETHDMHTQGEKFWVESAN